MEEVMNKGSVKDAFRKRQGMKQSPTNKCVFLFFLILVFLSQVNEYPSRSWTMAVYSSFLVSSYTCFKVVVLDAKLSDKGKR